MRTPLKTIFIDTQRRYTDSYMRKKSMNQTTQGYNNRQGSIEGSKANTKRKNELNIVSYLRDPKCPKTSAKPKSKARKVSDTSSNDFNRYLTRSVIRSENG